jgi:hypothetical protein
MLSNANKLEELRRIDRYREWRSLDDLRYCLWCGKLIHGFEIQVMPGLSDGDPLRAACPTEGCNSIPLDWATPTTEILMHINAAEISSPPDEGEFVSLSER